MIHLPVLVIVAGPPAAGKTTLARHLADHFHLPVVHRDQLKTQLYNALEPQQCFPTARLAAAAHSMMYTFAEAVLRAGQSVIIEAGFLPELATQELRALEQRVAFLPFQIQCYAEGHLLVERFTARIGTRHPAHPDEDYLRQQHAALLRGRWESLDIGGHLFALDTSNFATLEYEELYQALRHVLMQTQ
jgi:predicted kinase